MFVGIDVRAEGLNCVGVDDELVLKETALVTANEIATDLPPWINQAPVIAIDAPAELSTSPHAADDTLGRKFRAARCAEVDLGRRHGTWVSWVGPIAEPETGWMRTGFDLYARLRATTDASLLETYPHAAFRELAGARPAKKTSISGLRERVSLLRAAGCDAPRLEMWSHDSLDAAAAALVARDHHLGTAQRFGCGHDDSAIWLPGSPQAFGTDSTQSARPM